MPPRDSRNNIAGLIVLLLVAALPGTGDARTRSVTITCRRPDGSPAAGAGIRVAGYVRPVCEQFPGISGPAEFPYIADESGVARFDGSAGAYPPFSCTAPAQDCASIPCFSIIEARLGDASRQYTLWISDCEAGEDPALAITLELQADPPPPAEPAEPQYAAAGDWLLAVHGDPVNRVDILDSTTRQRVGTLDSCEFVRYFHAGNRIYVECQAEPDRIAFFDKGSRTTDVLYTGVRLFPAWQPRQGGCLYLTNEETGELIVFDAATGVEIGRIADALDSSGRPRFADADRRVIVAGDPRHMYIVDCAEARIVVSDDATDDCPEAATAGADLGVIRGCGANTDARIVDLASGDTLKALPSCASADEQYAEGYVLVECWDGRKILYRLADHTWNIVAGASDRVEVVDGSDWVLVWHMQTNIAEIYDIGAIGRPNGFPRAVLANCEPLSSTHLAGRIIVRCSDPATGNESVGILDKATGMVAFVDTPEVWTCEPWVSDCCLYFERHELIPPRAFLLNTCTGQVVSFENTAPSFYTNGRRVLLYDHDAGTATLYSCDAQGLSLIRTYDSLGPLARIDWNRDIASIITPGPQEAGAGERIIVIDTRDGAVCADMGGCDTAQVTLHSGHALAFCDPGCPTPVQPCGTAPVPAASSAGTTILACCLAVGAILILRIRRSW